MSNKRRPRRNKGNQSNSFSNRTASVADQLIDTSEQNYNRPARSTLAVIVLNALTCGGVGCGIAWLMGLWIQVPDGFTWQKYVIIAGVAALLQIGLAFINSLVMASIALWISRKVMQRRYGVIFDDNQIEEVKRKTEPNSRIGPASIAAATAAVALINQEAPTAAVIGLGAAAGALSPVVSHLTNHKDILNLWSGAKSIFYSITNRI